MNSSFAQTQSNRIVRSVRLGIGLAFLLTLASSQPAAHATPVTVQFSGVWDDLFYDTAHVLDGSTKFGSNFTATLTFDDTTPNLATGPFASTSGYYEGTSFTLETGNYSFTLPGTEVVGINVDHLFSTFPDQIILYAENYLLSGPLPGGISGGFGYANPELKNNSKTALANNHLTDVPWEISAWPSTYFYFFMGINGAGPDDYIELGGTITSITVPEPTAATLLVFGLTAICIRARPSKRD